MMFKHELEIRVRYGETDQLGTYYYGKAADWFEVGRTELLRSLGLPYSEIEARGLFLPVVEMHVEYPGRARYDDLLRMTVSAMMQGRVRLRCPVEIVNAKTGADVCRGHTVHAIINEKGKPVRAPDWFVSALESK